LLLLLIPLFYILVGPTNPAHIFLHLPDPAAFLNKTMFNLLDKFYYQSFSNFVYKNVFTKYSLNRAVAVNAIISCLKFIYLWAVRQCFQQLDYIASYEWQMSDNLQGKGHGLMRILSQHLPGRTEENRENPLVTTADSSTEILTEHLPNTSRKRYCNETLLKELHSRQTWCLLPAWFALRLWKLCPTFL
jgi:hypothetical protein